MTSSFTRSGTRRAGDQFQDILLVRTLVEWLANPDRYAWVVAEADDTSSLDDLRTMTPDGSLAALQVKFVTAPERADLGWTWGRMLDIPSSSGTSLLQKWTRDVERLLASATGPVRAGLVTNGVPAPSVIRALKPDGKLSLDLLDGELRARLVEHLGSAATLETLAHHFSFSFEEEGLEAATDNARRQFLALNGTEQGWLSLLEHVRSWVGRKDRPSAGRMITLADVRIASNWGTFSELTQNFAVPPDFVITSNDFHRQMVAKIEEGRDQVIVVTGTPGSGKSTYLSYLVTELRDLGHVVARHHYYLSDRDSAGGRIDHAVVVRSILSQLVSFHSDAVPGLSAVNPVGPESEPLVHWTAVAAQSAGAAGRRLVLVIDGLDHVWRERRSADELARLFEQLLPPRENVTVVLGTQRLDEASFPQRLMVASPTRTWLELSPLGRREIEQWLKHNKESLGIEANEDWWIADLAYAFQEVTGGHPLLLVYTLRAALEGGGRVTSNRVRTLPVGAPGDLDRYYDGLWISVPFAGRRVLHMIAVSRFPWRDGQIVDCLSEGDVTAEPANLDALSKVRHLLRTGPLGLRPFHASLVGYIEKLPEHATLGPGLRAAALAWLEERAPEYWRTAFRPQLASRDVEGHAAPARDDIRHWLGSGYPLQPLEDAIERARRAALSRGELETFVGLGLSLRYVELAYDSREGAVAMLRRALLWCGADPELRAVLRDDLGHLTDQELADLAQAEARVGHLAGVRECLGALNSRLGRSSRPHSSFGRDDWARQLEALATIVALLDDEHGSALDFAERLKGDGETFMRAFAAALRRDERSDVFQGLLGPELTVGRRLVARSAACALALQGAHMRPPEDLMTDPLVWLSLPPETRAKPRTVIGPGRAPSSLETSVVGRDSFAARYLAEAFFAFLAVAMDPSAVTIDNLPDAGGHDWLAEATRLLEGAAKGVASQLTSGDPIDPTAIYRACSSLRFPSDPGAFLDRDFAKGLQEAIVGILIDLHALAHLYGCTLSFSVATLRDVRDMSAFSWLKLAEGVIVQGLTVLEPGAATELISERLSDLAVCPVASWDVVEEFAVLANLAALCGDDELFELARQRCVDFLLAYGDRKDILLDHALDAVGLLTETPRNRVRDWLLRLAVPISAVTDYTDGAETRHLGGALGVAMVKAAPDLVPPYFDWLVRTAEYDAGSATLEAILEQGDLASPLLRAVAETAIDPGPRSVLRTRSNNGDAVALAVLQAMTAELGTPEPLREYGDQSGTRAERGLPLVEDFPPDSIRSYLEQSSVVSYDSSARVEEWFTYWNQQGLGFEACEAAFRWFDTQVHPRVPLSLVAAHLRYFGAKQTWPRLVAAELEGQGWRRHWGWYRSADQALRNDIVRETYTGRWLEYLQATLGPADAAESIVPLVQFLVQMGQSDVAARVIEAVVKKSEEVTAHLPIASPSWLPK